jgi:RpiB/LacA/LacB family sugar-phosphate isomerase
MQIALGSDHRGFHSKQRLKAFLAELGHDVVDCGTPSDASCDYPDFAVPACLLVAQHKADRGILMCGSGIGMTMTANKVSGIRGLHRRRRHDLRKAPEGVAGGVPQGLLRPRRRQRLHALPHHNP